MTSQLFNDDSLTVASISDFTPGIVNGSPFGNVYSVVAPIGSAAFAGRCYAIPGIGLVPFPTYDVLTTKTHLSAGTKSAFTLNALKCLPGWTASGVNYSYNNTIMASYTVWNNTGTTNLGFAIDEIDDLASGVVVNNTYAVAKNDLNTLMPQPYWVNLARAYWTQSGTGVLGVFSVEPTQATPSYVAIPDPNNVTASHVATYPVNNAMSAFLTNRMVFLGWVPFQPASGTLQMAVQAVCSGDIQADTNINYTNTEQFFPDVASPVGAWGSISTGETLLIFQAGGAVIVEGDIQNPSYVTILPGVTGTGLGLGPAVATPAGLLYPTESDGVWLWNGGNTSQKVSQQLVDTNFTRTLLDPNIANPPAVGRSSVDSWDNWVFFPGNWVFDCITGSWWQIEDPLVEDFQVFARSAIDTDTFYASPANVTTTTASLNMSIPIMKFQKTDPTSSWFWYSNPIPGMAGALTTLEVIEIVASNPSNTPCTIVITPFSFNQAQFPNGVARQSITFTIPPTTTSWRGLQRCGYNDYNMSISVIADNTNIENPAPILHEINLGYNHHSTSAVN